MLSAARDQASKAHLIAVAAPHSGTFLQLILVRHSAHGLTIHRYASWWPYVSLHQSLHLTSALADRPQTVHEDKDLVAASPLADCHVIAP
jgi:hypothetical protein